jgi:hypothetical protein
MASVLLCSWFTIVLNHFTILRNSHIVIFLQFNNPVQNWSCVIFFLDNDNFVLSCIILLFSMYDTLSCSKIILVRHIIVYYMCDFPAIKLKKERIYIWAVDQLQLSTCETRIGLLRK